MRIFVLVALVLTSGLAIGEESEADKAAEILRQAVPVPNDIKDMVAWVLDREVFGRKQIANRFSDRTDEAIAKFIKDLRGMALVKPDV